MENQGYVVAPLVIQPMNVHDSLLMPSALERLLDNANLSGISFVGSSFTLDSGFDAASIKASLEWNNFIPVIKPNRRGERNEQRLQELSDSYDHAVYKKRCTVERTFAWQDTYRKLVTRYEVLECTHLGFKYLAYSLMNLRSFLQRV